MKYAPSALDQEVIDSIQSLESLSQLQLLCDYTVYPTQGLEGASTLVRARCSL